MASLTPFATGADRISVTARLGSQFIEYFVSFTHFAFSTIPISEDQVARSQDVELVPIQPLPSS